MTNRSSAQLKGLAKKAMMGKYGTIVGAYLLLGAAPLLVNFLGRFFYTSGGWMSILINSLITFIIGIFISLLSAGFSYMLLNIARGEEFSLNDLLHCYRSNTDKMIVVVLFMAIAYEVLNLPFTILTYIMRDAPTNTLLFLTLIQLATTIVYVIFSLTYAFPVYLILDQPELSSIQAFKESRHAMRGNKGALFYIQMSFIGLVLLSALSCFIALLWVIPYMEMTIIYFYLDRTGELDRRTEPHNWDARTYPIDQ